MMRGENKWSQASVSGDVKSECEDKRGFGKDNADNIC